MAKYRAIQTNFWEDGFVLDLTPEEKYFYLYLLSNNNTTQCGCYELPYRVIEMQTGYNRETVEKLIQRFIEYGKIEYSIATKEILVKNWHKFNFTKSPKVESCIIKEVKNIKNTDFKKHLANVCIEYGYAIDRVSIDLGEKEKEKEKYIEQCDLLWKKYPNKKGKAIAYNKIPKLLKKYSLEELMRCIDRYSKEVQGKDKQYIKQGGTFFTNGYVDYLDENYEEAPQNNCSNSIPQSNNFKPKYKVGAGAGVNETFRNYDPDELEKLLKESQKGKF